MVKEKILLVEDEEDILELVQYTLTREGYRVKGVLTGEEGLKCLKEHSYDMVILDLMLPGLDGLEVCRRIKTDPEIREMPVIMLTARSEDPDVVAGLELGSDDYITKPFSPRVLVARVRAVMRRAYALPPEEEAPLSFGELQIFPGRFEVRVRKKPITMTPTEFRILLVLAKRPGWVFSRYQIIDAVQGEDHVVTDRSVDVQIVGLRRKLGPEGRHIETVRGVGYRFRE